MAAGINVPKDYISLFVETMSNHGWGYVNRQGNFVQLNRRNFKAVLRNFYDQHLKNKENDSKSKPATPKRLEITDADDYENRF